MVPLRVRSNYSLCAGGSTVESLVEAARTLGFRAMALTDVDGLYGAVRYFVAAKRAGLTPLIGAQTDGLALITRSRRGYANLCTLLSRHHLGRPCDLAEFQEDLHVLTEDPATAAVLRGRIDRLWLELVRPGRPVTHEIAVLEASRALGIPLVASLDVRFATPADLRTYAVLDAVRRTTTLDRIPPPDPERYLRIADFSDIEDHSEAVAADAAWDFLPAPVVFPSHPAADATAHLRALCGEGMRQRYGTPLRPALERLERELAVIGKLGFAEYFLVVHDIVQAARAQGAPVAGRGSGASSLAAYVLGITNVCPLRHNIPFERFLHEGRTDYPDLDLDFCWRTRDAILAGVFERHGRDRVAMVSSHITFQPRSAFREAARVHGLSDGQISRLQRSSPPEPGRRGVIEADARRLLGYPHVLSVHPGGLVIGSETIDRHTPVQWAEKGVIVSQFDKDGVEAVGLVKIDLLGNRGVSTVKEACERLGGLESESIPDGDAATIELLRSGRTIGVNQLESPAMRHLLVQMRPNGIAEVMKALALIRPGAASVGGKESFIRRHRGLDPWTVHPKLAPALGDSYGLMLYEDDAMLVASALAGATLAEGDRFRKRIQRCRTDDDRITLSREFLARCAAAGTPAPLARDLWVQMAKFNTYSFCMGHAASYAQIAYAAAWLRAHHPPEFWAAALNNNQGMYDKRVYVDEARRTGVRTLPPDVNRSGLEFTVESGALRVGFNSILGLEQRAIETIMAHRPFDSLFDFVCRCPMSLPGAQSLVACGAFDFLGRPRPELLLELQATWRRKKPLRVPPVRDYTPHEKALHEFEITGLCLPMHLLELLWPGHRDLVDNQDLFDSRAIPRRIGKTVRVAGALDALRVTATQQGESMEFLTLEDEHGIFEVALFPAVYRRFARVARTVGPYIVEGTVGDSYGAVTITASRLELRPPAVGLDAAPLPRTTPSWASGCASAAGAIDRILPPGN